MLASQLEVAPLDVSAPASAVFVTQPYLPPLEEFLPYLEQIWKSKWLTNNGPFHQQFEAALARHLGVEHLALLTNATIALITALQALRVTGEVITTPYSFVATAHSLLWNNLRPCFVDIDPTTMNLDPAKIEAAITPQTTAILPVHCYGNPCQVENIQQIADTYGLKLIYDAAHAFGVKYQGQSILKHGDLSILSFHATKVFNTFEGGAIICPDAKTKQRIDYLKNFGFADEVTVVAPGINGKMNELQAAFGLLQLQHIARAIGRRKTVDQRYRACLQDVPGIAIMRGDLDTIPNYAYFPILVGPDYPISRDGLYQRLRDAGIHARRYFYPLISDMPMYRGLPSAAPANLPRAKEVSAQILCLPIYPDLADEDQQRVIQVVRGEA
jgi:dTDP-4-amino-4,6-dideoxygalactose transaminase